MFDSLLYQVFEELVEPKSIVRCNGEYFCCGISKFSRRFTKAYFECFGYKEGKDFELVKSQCDVIIFLKRREEK